MRERPSIPEEDLQAVLREQYDLSAIGLEFLPLGHDSNAGVFRVADERGDVYFLKAKRGAFYEPSCLVPRHLRDQGITSMVAPLPTTRDAPWASAGEWTITLYPFIEGGIGMRLGMTDANWRDVGAVLGRIHRAPPPPEPVIRSLRKETFDPGAYRDWVRTFEASRAHAEDGGAAERALRASWEAHKLEIHLLLTWMENLAPVLRARSGPRVICHADLHANNILLDRAGGVHVIDWDDVMLAPKERDFLFVEDARASGPSPRGTPPFFQGYGEIEVDWVALAYYRCERVVTDLIAWASDVCFRDDLGDETKAEAIRLFDAQFAEGEWVSATFALAARLPSNLRPREGSEVR